MGNFIRRLFGLKKKEKRQLDEPLLQDVQQKEVQQEEQHNKPKQSYQLNDNDLLFNEFDKDTSLPDVPNDTPQHIPIAPNSYIFNQKMPKAPTGAPSVDETNLLVYKYNDVFLPQNQYLKKEYDEKRKRYNELSLKKKSLTYEEKKEMTSLLNRIKLIVEQMKANSEVMEKLSKQITAEKLLRDDKEKKGGTKRNKKHNNYKNKSRVNKRIINKNNRSLKKLNKNIIKMSKRHMSIA
jgi:hypothetical protein